MCGDGTPNDPRLYLSKHDPQHGAGRDEKTQEQQCIEERAHSTHRRHPLHRKDSADRAFRKPEIPPRIECGER